MTAENVAALLAGRGEAPIAACGYADGRGHPLAFSRRMFPELQTLHGDKAVWKLLDRYADEAVDVPIDGPIPPDIDTWEDYSAAELYARGERGGLVAEAVGDDDPERGSESADTAKAR